MSRGSGLITSEDTQFISANTLNYQEPDAFERITPYALEDVCIEFSRFSTFDIVSGYAAIENMMVNVLYTRIGERDFEPTFGSNVINLLFEPNTLEVNATLVEIEIYDRIRNWVPYIDVAMQGILVRSIPGQQAFQITVLYNERVTGVSRVFNAFLDRNSFQYSRAA